MNNTNLTQNNHEKKSSNKKPKKVVIGLKEAFSRYCITDYDENGKVYLKEILR